jgi:hypothetical protein
MEVSGEASVEAAVEAGVAESSTDASPPETGMDAPAESALGDSGVD